MRKLLLKECIYVYASYLCKSFQNSFSLFGSKQSAIGVLFRDQAMQCEKGEVMLCAGALGSPQLLLLSGIGPRPPRSWSTNKRIWRRNQWIEDKELMNWEWKIGFLPNSRFKVQSLSFSFCLFLVNTVKRLLPSHRRDLSLALCRTVPLF